MSLSANKHLNNLLSTDDEIDELANLFSYNYNQRSIKAQYERLNWSEHKSLCLHNKTFSSKYHMQASSFDILLALIRRKITVDYKQSHRSTEGNEPIYPELILACGLRFMGGELSKSLMDIFGISKNSTERVVNMFLDAIDECPDELVKIELPKAEEYENVRSAWMELVTEKIFDGVLLCIDGWLCCTNKPFDVNNTNDYFSGHYQRFSINVQACCDAHLRFRYAATISPGKTNDLRSFLRCVNLRHWMASLPDRYFMIGDNAYQLSRRMLIPFSGADRLDQHKTVFNFYLSQIRIRIEMSFGLLTSKFRIFRSNLQFSTTKNCKIIRVGMKLHNFVINAENPDIYIRSSVEDILDAIDPLPEKDFGVGNGERGYLVPTETQDELRENNNIFTLYDDVTDNSRRSAILNKVIQNDLQRPMYNLERNGYLY